jgi:uncharacterized OsmC-like protein
MNFDYHPDYDLTEEKRSEIVLRAKEVGPVLASAEANVSLSTVYEWMRDARDE